MQVEDEGEIQHFGTNKYILLVSCISNLFTSWHCLLKSRSIVHGCIQVWNQDSLGYDTESGWCRLHCKPYSGAVTTTGVVVQGFRSSSVPVSDWLVRTRTREVCVIRPNNPREYTEYSPSLGGQCHAAHQ